MGNQTSRIPNLSDTEPIRYRSYQIQNLSDTKLIKYHSYQIMNLLDTEYINIELGGIDSCQELVGCAMRHWWTSGAGRERSKGLGLT